MSEKVSYQCKGVVHDYEFLKHFLEVMRPLFEQHFGVEIPIVGDNDICDSEVQSTFGDATILYRHRTGLVDPYCGGTNWTIGVHALNFRSPGTDIRFHMDLWITDVAWSYTEATLRINGESLLVERLTAEIEPFLRASFQYRDDEVLPTSRMSLE